MCVHTGQRHQVAKSKVNKTFIAALSQEDHMKNALDKILEEKPQPLTINVLKKSKVKNQQFFVDHTKAYILTLLYNFTN